MRHATPAAPAPAASAPSTAAARCAMSAAEGRGGTLVRAASTASGWNWANQGPTPSAPADAEDATSLKVASETSLLCAGIAPSASPGLSGGTGVLAHAGAAHIPGAITAAASSSASPAVWAEARKRSPTAGEHFRAKAAFNSLERRGGPARCAGPNITGEVACFTGDRLGCSDDAPSPPSQQPEPPSPEPCTPKDHSHRPSSIGSYPDQVHG